MRRRGAGFSIWELLLSVALLSTFMGTLLTAMNGARSAQRTADLYAGDVEGLRRALDSLERDLREALPSSVTPGGGSVRVASTRGDILWAARRGVLTRREGGVESVVARNVAFFEVVDSAGGWRARIEPARRRGAGGQPARLTTVVVPRIPEAPR